MRPFCVVPFSISLVRLDVCVFVFTKSGSVYVCVCVCLCVLNLNLKLVCAIYIRSGVCLPV